MKRRDFLKAAGLGATSLVAPGSATLSASQAGKTRTDRPNIILLMADDCSAKEFGCYGNREHKTPVLDQLARTGASFNTCWCTPICSPSRALILTGRYGFRTGWFHNNMKPSPKKKGGDLSTTNKIFAQLLKQAGYATAICGKWQLHGRMRQYGFDEHCMWQKYEGFDGPVETKELKGKRGVYLGRAARYWHPSIVKNDKPVPTTDKDYGPDLFVDFLLDFAKRQKDGPFLVYYPMCLPHRSWDFEAGRSGYLPVPELDRNGVKTGRKVPGTLKSNVEYIDHLVGRIVKGLERLGLRKNTVIGFTCDNGTSGYGKAQVIEERGPRVPMIVNGPSVVKPRGAVDALIDFADVLPTLCDLAGATPPADHVIDGQSFVPVLRGEKDDAREWIFSCYADKRMLRDKRWLLDGRGRFFDCGNRRDEVGYKDVTRSNDPEVVAARKRFEDILKRLPGPTKEQMGNWSERRRPRRKGRSPKRRRRDASGEDR